MRRTVMLAALFVSIVSIVSTSGLAAPAAPSAAPAKAAKAKAAAIEVNVKPGDEVDITSGAVTALACAIIARDEGNLEALNSCPLEEAQKGIVVFDVEERQIYQLDTKKVRRFELEKAFAGGSIDFAAVVKKVDGKSGVAQVVVDDYSVTAKPKAGAFKGCL